MLDVVVFCKFCKIDLRLSYGLPLILKKHLLFCVNNHNNCFLPADDV